MNARQWTLVGVFAALILTYIVFFTEWLRTAPIQIASQVRFSIQPPNFGRSSSKTKLEQKTRLETVSHGATGEVKMVHEIRTNHPMSAPLLERIGRPAHGTLDQAPGGVANITFSLDGWYQLTRIRVEDVPADGSQPKLLWEVKGKSLPLDSLLYGHNPQGMNPLVPGEKEEPLVAGVPYRLIVEAGRRRGTNFFSTVPAAN